MKKFLVILMVVAMASFLFVGCVPTTPAEEEAAEEEVPEEEVPVVAKTDTPTITSIDGVSLYSSDTQYTNEISVGGISVKDATIKLYVDDTLVGIAVTGDTAAFSELDDSLAEVTEGEVVLYVTATATGLAESDASTKYTFTFDETAPTLASAVADSSDDTITVTFSEDVNMNLSDTTSTTFTWLLSAMYYGNWQVNDVTLSSAPTNSNYATISKLTDKKVRLYFTATANSIVGNEGYFIECVDVLDMAGNPIATDSDVDVGVTAIATP